MRVGNEPSPDIGILGRLACFDTVVSMFLERLCFVCFADPMFSEVRSDRGYISCYQWKIPREVSRMQFMMLVVSIASLGL